MKRGACLCVHVHVRPTHKISDISRSFMFSVFNQALIPMSGYFCVFIPVKSQWFSISTNVHMEKFPGMYLRKSTVTLTYSLAAG